MSAPAKPKEVDTQERSPRARSLLIQAAFWAPSVVELYRASRSQRDNAPSLAWAGSSRMPAAQPAVRRSETGPPP